MSSDGSTVLFGALPPQFTFSPACKRRLTRFARKLAHTAGGGKSFDCLITDDGELQRLNKIFLQHDYPTDVLSFPASNPAPGLGECAISVERADEQSRLFGHSLLQEIEILMLHAVLHLTGMDHERDGGAMARAEQHWRAELKLPQSLIERSMESQAQAV